MKESKIKRFYEEAERYEKGINIILNSLWIALVIFALIAMILNNIDNCIVQ